MDFVTRSHDSGFVLPLEHGHVLWQVAQRETHGRTVGWLLFFSPLSPVRRKCRFS